MRTLRAGKASDGGFTVAEVLVALSLFAIIAGSLASALLASMAQATRLQHRQVAVALADRQLQVVQAVDATRDAQGCTNLLKGRQEADAVQLQLEARALGLALSSDPAWGANGCPGSPTVLPLRGLLPVVAGVPADPVVIGAVTYRVNTLIGSCWVGVGHGCAPAAHAGPNDHQVYEVLVWVTWPGRTCPAGTCLVDVSTIVDPQTDPVFGVRNAAAPVARDDAVCVLKNTATAINVLANDAGSLGAAPVLVETMVDQGTLADLRSGTAGYTPPAGYTGSASFTYRLTDVNGALSWPATVWITVAATC